MDVGKDYWGTVEEYNRWRKRQQRAVMAAAIDRLRVEDPARYAELLKRAQSAEYDRQVLREAEEAARLKVEAEKFASLNKPVLVGLPDVGTSSLRGVVALRVWSVRDGWLQSGTVRYKWRALNFADKVPTESNSSGLYCIKLSSLSVIGTGSSYFAYTGLQGVCGFVELLGKVVEHADGVMRAEVARLVCLFVTSDNPQVSETVQGLYHNYPAIPLYVLNPEQVADAVLREVLVRKYVRGEV